MARSRNIKPGFFINDELAEIDPLGRLLFAGLWTIADRAGRIKDSPKRIKACALPYDECDIDVLLHSLHTHNFIVRYEIAGEKYIQINNWAKHQNPHKNEPPSTIPPIPEQFSASTIQEQDLHSSNRADSLNLIPDSLNLIPDSPAPPGEAREKQNSHQIRFDQFWSAYPKKRSKGQAEKAWAKIKPDEQLHDRIIKSLERAKTSADWKKEGGQYIPYPATWLNGKGWEDEIMGGVTPDEINKSNSRNGKYAATYNRYNRE